MKRKHKIKVAYLQITTWADNLIVYAEHYYGKLKMGKLEIELKYKLSQTDAIRLNKVKERSLFSTKKFRYIKGDTTIRFPNKDKLLKQAIKIFNSNSHRYNVLFEDGWACCDPRKMLVGPKEIMFPANKLNDQFEKLHGWMCPKKDEKKVQDICNKWEKIVGRHWIN